MQDIKKNREIMEKVMKVLQYEKISDLATLTIEAAEYLEGIERRSLLQDTKANSLLSRWFNKPK